MPLLRRNSNRGSCEVNQSTEYMTPPAPCVEPMMVPVPSPIGPPPPAQPDPAPGALPSPGAGGIVADLGLAPSGPPQPSPATLQPKTLYDLVVPESEIEGLYAEPIIEGFQRVGEVAMLSAAAKAMKTMFVHYMLMRVSTGKPVLDLHVPKARRTLLVDFELPESTVRARLSKFAGVKDGEPRPEWLKNASAISVREDRRSQGESLLGTVEDITAVLEEAQKAGRPFEYVIIDCLTRVPEFLAQETENDNLSSIKVMQAFCDLADKFKTGILIVHHTPKGGGAGKSVVDRGRGASAMAGVVETVASIGYDGGDEQYRQLEWVARTFKPEPTRVMRLDMDCYPAEWRLTETTPLPKGKAGSAGPDSRQVILALLREYSHRWLTSNAVLEVLAAGGHEIGIRTIRDHLKQLAKSQVVESEGTGNRNENRFRLTNREKVEGAS